MKELDFQCPIEVCCIDRLNPQASTAIEHPGATGSNWPISDVGVRASGSPRSARSGPWGSCLNPSRALAAYVKHSGGDVGAGPVWPFHAYLGRAHDAGNGQALAAKYPTGAGLVQARAACRAALSAVHGWGSGPPFGRAVVFVRWATRRSRARLRDGASRRPKLTRPRPGAGRCRSPARSAHRHPLKIR